MSTGTGIKGLGRMDYIVTNIYAALYWKTQLVLRKKKEKEELKWGWDKSVAQNKMHLNHGEMECLPLSYPPCFCQA